MKSLISLMIIVSMMSALGGRVPPQRKLSGFSPVNYVETSSAQLPKPWEQILIVGPVL